MFCVLQKTLPLVTFFGLFVSIATLAVKIEAAYLFKTLVSVFWSMWHYSP